MARPPHQPDPASRRQVEALAGYGIPEAEIAGLIGVNAKTLRKHYRAELDQGHTKANARVAENLFRKATGEDKEAVTAAIFWLKARAGWREVQRHELAGVAGEPIQEIRRIIIDTPGADRLQTTVCTVLGTKGQASWTNLCQAKKSHSALLQFGSFTALEKTARCSVAASRSEQRKHSAGLGLVLSIIVTTDDLLACHVVVTVA